MNAAAAAVMKELPDLVLAYGVSDEFRCVSHPRHALLNIPVYSVGPMGLDQADADVK